MMKYGLAFPNNEARQVAALAKLAEDCGWDGCFLGDFIWGQDPMIALTAAAMVTSRIRLGTMVIPVPIRRPWKIANESVALDRLSGGRLILGLGTGATWMGWGSFPDEVTDTRARIEMLEETIDILTLLYQRKPFDFEGRHYHLKLTLLGEEHYPPPAVQQPRIPLWAPLIWPRPKSMRRVLKCDGLFVEKLNPDGKPGEVTPEDVAAIRAFVDANRTLSTPFDIVVSGKSGDTHADQPWSDSGATWWVEDLWGESEDAVAARIQQGPPDL